MFVFQEFIDAIIMTFGIGYIFMNVFKNRPKDVLVDFKSGFNWGNFWFACSVVVPAIIFHELAHKFFALSFGMQATFHAHYTFLGLGILLKLMNFGFIFFVPGFVSILGTGTNLQFAMISFAGPLMHALFWIGSSFALKNLKLDRKKTYYLLLTKKINGFLFILNMLPIPGIDGFSVYSNLLNAFF
ncbi:hypothetical protein CMO90_01175 [Candidatus Woesearchaeota archaeon]|jgi:Zn-dependent protease|nr:hypothetical protein [Candidatus Woesearchaeota archaeon]|tara:strand:- start:2054 stop:2611 length:558 start_codon:yes stop_codon:yes gene_type:complete